MTETVASRTPLLVLLGYLALLVVLGAVSRRFFRGTADDFFVASRSIGPFMLLMSLFGTNMTAFALVGSTGEAFRTGIGVFGMLASWSALLHPAIFFLVGIRLWAIGRRNGYATQCEFFRERFESPAFAYALFVVLVALLVPYLLIGLLGAGSVVESLTQGMFPGTFARGAVPPSLTALVVSLVVLSYVFVGGVRSTAWANTFQTVVFLGVGVATLATIGSKLGGAEAAYRLVAQHASSHLSRAQVSQVTFAAYAFIPISMGMFPHIFQHWLTARSARAFRVSLVGYPICMVLLWVPTVLLGTWAAGLSAAGRLQVDSPNHVLGLLVATLVDSPLLTGVLGAGILAAIMSSLDSQFMSLSTMFTNDIVGHLRPEWKASEAQTLWMARGFVVAIVAVTYLVSLFASPAIFPLGIWCFTGFAGLVPLVVAAIYWRRATRLGAAASLATTTIATLGFFAVERAQGTPFAPLGLLPVVYVVVASALALVGASLVSAPPREETLSRFFASR